MATGIVAAGRWRFTLPGVFIVTGVLGVFIEQSGAVIREIIGMALANPLLAMLLALDIFAVYGSIMGLAYLPLATALQARQRRLGWLKYPVVMALMFLGASFGVIVVDLLAAHAGLIPPRRPIWEHPFF